jgi:hypothetical protein
MSKKEQEHSQPHETATFIDGNAFPNPWHVKIATYIQNDRRIIALRGAGSVQGIGKEESNNTLLAKLIEKVKQYLENNESVCLMFDGDGDSPDNPDIGYIMGRLRDEFNGAGFMDRVVFITAQKSGWYSPRVKNDALRNVNGLPYQTFIFSDDTFEGDHNSFTQSLMLADYHKYEQWFIGAAGPISLSQLEDLNRKLETLRSNEKRDVFIFRALQNEEQTAVLQAKLENAKASENVSDIQKIQRKLDQRKKKYGELWTNDGQPAVDPSRYPHLNLYFII